MISYCTSPVPAVGSQTGGEVEPFPLDTANRFAIAFFALLAAFYFIFWRDLFFWDNARFIYPVVFDGAPRLAFGRYGHLMTDWPAALAGLAGATPDVIARGYHLGYWFFHVMIYLLLRFGLGERPLAGVYVLFVLAGLTHGAIYPWDGGVSSSFCFLLVALFKKSQTGVKIRGASAACAVLPVAAMLYHPLGVFACAFAVVHSLAGRRFRPSVLHSAAIAGMLLMIWIKAAFPFEYEIEKVSKIATVPAFAELWANVVYFATEHFAACAAALILLLRWLRNPRALTHLVPLAFLFVYIQLANSVYSPSRVAWVYSWHSYGPIYAFVLIPLFDTPPVSFPRLTNLFRCLVAAAILIRCAFGVSADLHFMALRRAAIFDLYRSLPEPNGRRFLLDAFSNRNPLLTPLGLMEESALQLKFSDPAVSFHLESESYVHSRTTGAVRVNSKADADAVAGHAAAHVTLALDERPVVIAGKEYVMVTLSNHAATQLPSRDHQWRALQIACYWSDPAKPGTPVGLRATPLIMDVHRQYRQLVAMPARQEFPEGGKLGVGFYLNDRLIQSRVTQ